jgi:hypothetical protein
MKVTFTKTAERRYRVSVEGPGVVPSFMEPAPGYDARLPHDMAHFVVENELGIAGGIFGQLAAGGHARTFHPSVKTRRKVAKQGDRMAHANRDDSMLSEAVVYLACTTWSNGTHHKAPQVKGVTAEDIERVCREFDAVSAVWSKLKVGESMTLAWRGAARVRRRQPHQKRTH